MYTRNRPTVYLCGPITGLSHDEARLGWRKWMRDELAKVDIDTISPMRGTDFLPSNHTMSAHGSPEYLQGTPKFITARDRWDTMRSDLVFANLLGATEISIGSVGEVFWCDSVRTPMIIAMEEDNVHQHAMIQELSIIVPDLETGIHVIKSFLIPSI